ncbi:hypothetical protein GCQ56_08215 [Marinifilum sp. N1E240]|uniref:DUF6686 family protein n=1 Tax=Marinifilum sp. N1E240 TaxID=2608082 RepID=UPI00128BBA73|nr:DUF6686 family protein [Marinifilum sp. N1E240]MPQ46999.1 hypothetical protein [Marinifilum sp. N1E240]
MIYNRTSNGSLFRCDSCQSIHMEFNNMNINFTTEEKYLQFADYIHEISIDAALQQNAHSPYQRKIVIPIGGGGCNFMLHPGELEDLKRLCISNLNKSIVSLGELKIDYSLN